ncbi:MAG TPA: hypothetical protein VIW73_04960, partial [Candidatus Cybelea sp.]
CPLRVNHVADVPCRLPTHVRFTPLATKSRFDEKCREGPIAVVSGLLNSKKLLRCTFGDNLERRPKCWIAVLRVGGIVHVRQHCASVPPYGLIGRTSSSAPFRFSSVDNRHAAEAQACRRRRVLERRPF